MSVSQAVSPGLPMRLRRAYWTLQWRVRVLIWRFGKPDHVKTRDTGKTIYLDPADQRSRSLWLSRGNLNADSMRLWRHMLGLKPWTVVLDVGANLGEMICNAPLPPGAKVFAFEPNPRIAALLRRSIAAGGVPATVIEAAVGETDGSVVLNVSPNWSGTSSVLKTEDNCGGQAVSVRQIKLASFLAESGIAPQSNRLIIKIDVEGYEYAVLRGLRDTIRDWQDVMIMIEIMHAAPERRAEIEDEYNVSVLEADGSLRMLAPGEQTTAMDVILTPK